MKFIRSLGIGLAVVLVTLLIGATLMFFRKNLKDPPRYGESAPQFEMETVSGSRFNLWEASDTTTVYLSFLRYTSCPVCNYRVHDLIENYNDIKTQGILPILVFESESEDLEKYVDFYEIPFEIIADPDKTLYDLYEVEENMIKTIISSESALVEEQLALGADLFYDEAPLEEEGNLARLPADFVIRNGRFLTVKYGKNIGDHLPVQQMLSIAAKELDK